MSAPIIALPMLEPAAQAEVRRRAIFECGKWDPHVGDTEVLAPFAFEIDGETWRELADAAEVLAAETLALEAALLDAPALWPMLGLGRQLRRALDRARSGAHVRGPRLMRFDFHRTAEGWRISEVNADVPGGFIEAGGFTRLMHEHAPGASALHTPPDPARAVAQALLAHAAGREGDIALVHATAYSDDRSVAEALAREFRALGREARPVAPDAIAWSAEGEAHFLGDGAPVAALHRFFPAEWLPNLPRGCGWERFFADSPVPQCNPATAILTQSKRHPLAWDALGVHAPRWRALLPETLAPSERLRRDAEWLLKPTWGRIGGGIVMHGHTPEREARRLRWSSRFFPREWVAQRRFRTEPVPTPFGPLFPCLGVYVVEGAAAGIYARASRGPVVADQAWDIAVLVRERAAATRRSTLRMEAAHVVAG